MTTDYSTLVSKVWNFAHVLRDQGISYGDYIEQITFLLFLKMDQERTELLGEPSIIPAERRDPDQPAVRQEEQLPGDRRRWRGGNRAGELRAG